jgi:hypothetical protein
MIHATKKTYDQLKQIGNYNKNKLLYKMDDVMWICFKQNIEKNNCLIYIITRF